MRHGVLGCHWLAAITTQCQAAHPAGAKYTALRRLALADQTGLETSRSREPCRWQPFGNAPSFVPVRRCMMVHSGSCAPQETRGGSAVTQTLALVVATLRFTSSVTRFMTTPLQQTTQPIEPMHPCSLCRWLRRSRLAVTGSIVQLHHESTVVPGGLRVVAPAGLQVHDLHTRRADHELEQADGCVA